MAELSEDDKKEIMSSEQYRNMPIYPDENAIQKINNVWVVKMCENED